MRAATRSPHPTATPGLDTAPLPGPGARAWLGGLTGGSLPTVVIGPAGDVLRVDVPRLGGRHVRVDEGREAVLLYRDREVPCLVRVRALATPAAGELALLPVAPPTRIQRRQAVRVAACLDAVLLVPGEAGDDPVTHRVTTRDISCTGVLLAAEDPPPAGCRVRLRLCGLDASPVEVAARVVRVGRAPGGVGLCALELEDPGPRERRLLRGFLMDRQRALRRRELGLDPR